MKIGVDMFSVQANKHSIISSNSSERQQKNQNKNWRKYYLFYVKYYVLFISLHMTYPDLYAQIHFINLIFTVKIINHQHSLSTKYLSEPLLLTTLCLFACTKTSPSQLS